MQPLQLPRNTQWRVVRCRRIRVKPSKNYYIAEVDFQKIVDPESISRMISNQYKTVEMNISQIKYFPIGSIWENDKLVRGVDYFEKFSMQDSILFSDNISVVLDNQGNYILEKFHPRIDTNAGRYSFASPLCIYENQDLFSFPLSSHKAAFIAFPCYEIARFFLLSIGTYNDKLLRADLANSLDNLLFDNSETWWCENEDGQQQLHIKLKQKVPYRRYLNVSDLASSAKFREMAMKLQGYLKGHDPFSGIELPINRFDKLLFSAKRVQRRTDGAWGLWVPVILSCTGYRNFDQVEVDHEDPSRKKLPDSAYDDWEEDDVENERVITVNTGTSEDYNDDELTNNDLPPLIEPVSPLMAAFAEDSEIVPYRKINEKEIVSRPTDVIINEIEANERALQTDESNPKSTVQPVQFDEGGDRTRYSPNGMRDESEDSAIYPERFFQDFEKIAKLITEQLKQTYGNRFSVRFADENLNFDSVPGKFRLYKMMSGVKTPFLLRNVTKHPRLIYLVEFLVDGRCVYLLEPEFQSSTQTTTTLTFHKTSYMPASKDELQRFFQIYIQAKGVKRSMETFEYITKQFQISATDHEIEKKGKKIVLDENGNQKVVKDGAKLTVGEALTKHACKLAVKLMKT